MKRFGLFIVFFAALFVQQSPVLNAYAQDRLFEPIAPIVPQRQNQTPSGNEDRRENSQTTVPDASLNPGAVLDQPVCGGIVNQTVHKIYVEIVTDIAGMREGIEARHRHTFNLKAQERADVCSQGPFYDGQRLTLKLRSLFPLFECKTQINQRTIIIQNTSREDGTPRFFATCY